MKESLFSLLRYVVCIVVLGAGWSYPLAAATPEMPARPASGFTHEFWMYYLTVQHSLKGYSGQLNAAVELDRLNPKATGFIAKYWWKKIERDCGLNHNMETTYHFKHDEVDILQNVDEETKYCAYEVVFNNWAEINNTIINRLSTERHDTRQALLASLKAAGLSDRAF